MSLNTKHTGSAFSLVELLSVLVVLMFLAKQVWSSNLARWFEKTDYEQLLSSQQSLARGLTLARQFAVQAKQTVSFCAGDYHQADCGGNWSEGWFILLDSKIKTFHLFPAGMSVVWSGFPAGKKQIDFFQNGHSGYQNGTFYLCQFGLMTNVVVNQSGRIYLGDISQLTDLTQVCE